jgi:Tol biopolymer transport system component/DNA-binding winged helix-turn-helix (wHTH) protein
VIYSFGDVSVDTAAFELRRSGSLLHLEPKSIRVLILLIENRDRVVSKEELFQTVWEGVAVSDNALTRVIAQLRKALGDDPRQPSYIETIPTVGYRFVAELNKAEAAPEFTRRLRVTPVTAGALIGAFAVTALAATWMFRGRPQTEPPLRTPVAMQLTTSTGLDLSPSFSPDGSAIAYSSDASGRFEIYVRPIALGGAEVQITNDGAQNLQPAWSPDGRMIAYHSAVRGGIRVVPALGGVTQQVSEFGSKPAWSPDSRMIAFQSEAPASVALPELFPVTPSTIWVVPSAGGPARRLTIHGRPAGRHAFPAWSPDGTRIAFVSFTSLNASEIWSVSIKDGSLSQLLTGEKVHLTPAYAPDGKNLYYSAFSSLGEFGLWRLPLDPTTNQASGKPVELQRTGSELPRELSVSPDGRRIAYALTTMTSNLWSQRLSTETLTPSGSPALFTKDTSYRKLHPAFSPDGEQVAFFLVRKGFRGDIWVTDADGNHPAPVTTNPLSDYLPSWMPGGRSVAYVSKRGKHNLWITSLDDRVEKPLANIPQAKGPMSVSPDGRSTVFSISDKNGVLNIGRTSLLTGEYKQLTFDKESIGFPCWSPDGKWIAVEIRRGDSTHLGVISSDGGPVTQLTSGREHAWPYGWSPDSDKIAVAGLRDGAWNIWWISRRDGNQKKLTNYDSFRSYVRYPAWSPKGDRIVYEYAETLGNIFVTDLP